MAGMSSRSRGGRAACAGLWVSVGGEIVVLVAVLEETIDWTVEIADNVVELNPGAKEVFDSVSVVFVTTFRVEVEKEIGGEVEAEIEVMAEKEVEEVGGKNVTNPVGRVLIKFKPVVVMVFNVVCMPWRAHTATTKESKQERRRRPASMTIGVQRVCIVRFVVVLLTLVSYLELCLEGGRVYTNACSEVGEEVRWASIDTNFAGALSMCGEVKSLPETCGFKAWTRVRPERI